MIFPYWRAVFSKGDTIVVDDKLILRKIADLDLYHQQMNEFKAVTLKEYRKDWKAQRIVERTLQMMIETCTDISGHIISDRKYRVPKNYADAFKILWENNIIEESLSETMQKMAKFRNIVVHNYDDVDAEIVIGILRRHMDDFIVFKKAIITTLETQTGQPK